MKAIGMILVLACASAVQAGPLVNGDFASGDLTGWSTVGPVTVSAQVAYLQEVASDSTQLLQTFTIPAGATKLGFDYAFDSVPAGTGEDGPDELWCYLLDPATYQPILHTPSYQEFLYAVRTGYRDYDPSIVTLADLGGALPWVRVSLNLTSLTLPRDARLVFSLASYGHDGYATNLAVDNVIVTIPFHGGDANNDGHVNVGDLGILAVNWSGTGKTWSTGDFTGDGLVNVGDLGVLAVNWGWSGAPADGPVPEPASLVLVLTGLLLMGSQPRRT